MMARMGMWATTLALLLAAGTAQAQTTSFTYRELDRGTPATLARKTLGVLGERFPRMQREKSGGMIYGGERYLTFAGQPESSFDGGCEVRRAHASYLPLERNGRAEPPNARLKLDDVWFDTGFGRLAGAPAYDGSDSFEGRVDRLCAKMVGVFDMFSAKDAEAAGRAMKIVDKLVAGPAPLLDCDPGADCPALVRKALSGRLFHVEQWDCGPLVGNLPAAEVMVCQELRFDLEPHDDGHVGALRVRFREGTDYKTQTRILTLEAVHVSEAHYVE